MKLNAEVKVIKPKGVLKLDDMLDVPLDEDYINDYDDVIRCVEDHFWQSYGLSMFVGEDVTITNSYELSSEIFDEDNN